MYYRMIVLGWNLEYRFRSGKEKGILVGMAMLSGRDPHNPCTRCNGNA